MAKDNKREQILNALEQLLPGRRFHEITLDEVSRAAQVGKGTIYLYFQDKDALFVEMVCFRLEKLSDELSLLSGCSINELPGRVFELVGDFIRRHHSRAGQLHREGKGGDAVFTGDGDLLFMLLHNGLDDIKAQTVAVWCAACWISPRSSRWR